MHIEENNDDVGDPKKTIRRPSIPHIAATVAAFGTAAGNIIYAMIALRSMPNTVGYHFAADGTFDLFGAKSIAFLHPIIADLLMLVIFELLAFVATRLRPIKHLSPKANRIFSHCTVLVCDLFALATAATFTYWICCVARQTPMNTEAIKIVLLIPVVALVALFVGLTGTILSERISHRKR